MSGPVRGVQRVADLRQFPDMIEFIRAAFIKESGEALIRRHSGLDPLFTREGYREYAEDLLERMLNPYLQDTMERVGRDPERKLGWDDRLAGTIRIALGQGIAARRFAVGAAAALAVLDPSSGRRRSSCCRPAEFSVEPGAARQPRKAGGYESDRRGAISPQALAPVRISCRWRP